MKKITKLFGAFAAVSLVAAGMATFFDKEDPVGPLSDNSFQPPLADGKTDPAAAETWLKLLKAGQVRTIFPPTNLDSVAQDVIAEVIENVKIANGSGTAYEGKVDKNTPKCFSAQVRAAVTSETILIGPSDDALYPAMAMPLYSVFLENMDSEGRVAWASRKGAFFKDVPSFLAKADNEMLDRTMSPDMYESSVLLHAVGCRSSFEQARQDAVALNAVTSRIMVDRLQIFFQALKAHQQLPIGTAPNPNEPMVRL